MSNLAAVLREFCRAGAVRQLNLTLCRQRSVRAVAASMQGLCEHKRARVLADPAAHTQLFFGPGSHGVPRQLRVAAVLRARGLDEVAVVTFAAPKHFDLSNNLT